MKPITHEWIDKAEEDWTVALLAQSSPQSKVYNAICFHTQQCSVIAISSLEQVSNVGHLGEI